MTSTATTGGALSANVPAPARMRIDAGRVADLIRQLLIELGEDPTREGLAATPGRVAAMWEDFLSPDSAPATTCFSESHLSGQMVVVGGMSVWSFCEHHMIPMQLEVAAAYMPEGQVVGLSKFGRIAQHFAGRLQVQERFTRQIAEHLADVVGSDNVAVAVRGVHLCMSMRGVRMHEARTTTMHTGGRFGADPLLSQQFLTVAAGQWGAV
jgi:GTP cyclohydrolase I